MTFWFGYQMSGRIDNTNAIDTVSLCYIKTCSIQKKWEALGGYSCCANSNSTADSKATSVLKAQWHALSSSAGCLCLLTDIVYTVSLLPVSSVSNLMR